MTAKDIARIEVLLGYKVCFATWGSLSGTHICIRPAEHDGEHWSGACCDKTISEFELDHGSPLRNVTLPTLVDKE